MITKIQNVSFGTICGFSEPKNQEAIRDIIAGYNKFDKERTIGEVHEASAAKVANSLSSINQITGDRRYSLNIQKTTPYEDFNKTGYLISLKDAEHDDTETTKIDLDEDGAVSEWTYDAIFRLRARFFDKCCKDKKAPKDPSKIADYLIDTYA